MSASSRWVLPARAGQGWTAAYRAAFVLSFIWVDLRGAAGHWEGRVVFRDPPNDAGLP